MEQNNQIHNIIRLKVLIKNFGLSIIDNWYKTQLITKNKYKIKK